MRNNVLSVKNQSFKGEKGNDKNEKILKSSIVSNRTRFKALSGLSSVKKDITISSVTSTLDKEELLIDKNQIFSRLTTFDSGSITSYTTPQYKFSKFDFQEDFVSEESAESAVSTEGIFVPFTKCPLTSNGMWAHIPSNWLKVMSQILDIINKAIKENNVDILFELQQSKRQFYEQLVERFIINFKNPSPLRYSDNSNILERGIKNIMAFGKDSLSHQQLTANMHLKNPEFIYSLKGFSKGKKYEKAVKNLKNESFMHGLIGFMETLTADRKKTPSPGSDGKILHKIKKISKMDFLPSTIHSLLKFESAAQNEKDFINILEGPLMYGTSDVADEIEARQSFKAEDEYDDSDFSEFSEKFCEKTPEKDTIAESVESDKTEDMDDFEGSFSEDSYEDVELFDITLNSKVYERSFQKTSVYRALKSTLTPMVLTEKDIQDKHRVTSPVKSNKPGLDSIRMEIVLQSSRLPSTDDNQLLDVILNSKFALQNLQTSDDLESIRMNLSKSSSPDYLNFKMGLGEINSIQKEEIFRKSGVLGSVSKTNEDFLSSKNYKQKTNQHLSSLTRLFNQLSSKSFDSRPSLLKNLKRSLQSIPESRIMRSSKMSGSITRKLFADSLNDPLFINRTKIPESSIMTTKSPNKNKASKISRDSFKKTRKGKISTVKRESYTNSDNQMINLSRPSKHRPKNPFVSYQVLSEETPSIDTMSSLHKKGKISKDHGKKIRPKQNESRSEMKSNIFMIKNKHRSNQVKRRETISALDLKLLRRYYRAFYKSVALRNLKKRNSKFFGRIKCIENKPALSNEDKIRFINRNYYFLKNWTWPMSAHSSVISKPIYHESQVKIVPIDSYAGESLLGKLLKPNQRRSESNVSKHFINCVYRKKVRTASPRTMTIFQPGDGMLNPFKIVYSLKTSHDKVDRIKPGVERTSQTVAYVPPSLFRVHITEPMKFNIDYQMLLKDYRYKSKCIPCIKEYERRNFSLKIGLPGNSNLANTSNAGTVSLINDLHSKDKIERYISENDWKLAIDSKFQEKDDKIGLVKENIETPPVLVFPQLLNEFSHMSALTIHRNLFKKYVEKYFNLSYSMFGIVPELSVNRYLKSLMNCGTETTLDKATTILCDSKTYLLTWFDLDTFKVNPSLSRKSNKKSKIATESQNKKSYKLVDYNKINNETKSNLLSSSYYMDNNVLLDALLKDFSIKSIRTQCDPEIPYILFTSNNDNRESSLSNNFLASKFIKQNRKYKISIERSLPENCPFQRSSFYKKKISETKHSECLPNRSVNERLRRAKVPSSGKIFNKKETFSKNIKRSVYSKRILRDLSPFLKTVKKSNLQCETSYNPSRSHSENQNLLEVFASKNISNLNVNTHLKNKASMNSREVLSCDEYKYSEILQEGKKNLQFISPVKFELQKSLVQFNSWNYINNYIDQLINEKLIFILKSTIENEFVEYMITSFQNFQKLKIGKRISPNEIFCKKFTEIIRGISDSEIYDNANDLKTLKKYSAFHRLKGNNLENNSKIIPIGQQIENRNCPISARESKNQNCKDKNFNNNNNDKDSFPTTYKTISKSIYEKFSNLKHLLKMSERNVCIEILSNVQKLFYWVVLSTRLDVDLESDKRRALNPRGIVIKIKLLEIISKPSCFRMCYDIPPTISFIKLNKNPKRLQRQPVSYKIMKIETLWKFRKNTNRRFNTVPFEFDDFTNQNNYKTTKRKFQKYSDNTNLNIENKLKSEKDSLFIQNIFNNIFKAIKFKEFISYRNKFLRKRKKR